MLQYIVKSDNAEEIISQSLDALEAGCKWIEIKVSPDVEDKTLERVIDDLKPLIKKHDANLVLASRVTLAKQTGVDGVQLYEGDMPPSAARMELEAGPIIGMSVRTTDAVERNMYLDIDFFRMEPLFEEASAHLDTLGEMARILRDAKSDKPLAAAGGITADNIEGVLAAGAEGVAVDSTISDEKESLRDAISHIISVAEKG